MKQSVFWQGFLVASLVATPLFVSGCKKKDGTASQGSGSAGSAAATPPATGSGSAAAEPAGSGSAAGSAAAASAPGAAAGPANITAKRKDTDEGTFNKALYSHRELGYRVYAVANCDKLNCAHIDEKGDTTAGFETDCPSYKLLTIDFNFDADAKPGDVEVGLNVSSSGRSNGITSNWTAGGKVASISDKEFNGSIDVKDGDSSAKGDFTATVCK